jgi:putative aldouronate transport system permease protein
VVGQGGARHGAIRETKADAAFLVTIYAVSFFILCIVLYPLVYVLSASLSSSEATAAGRVFVFPVDFSVEGYKLVFERQDILVGFRNTIAYTLAGTTINLVMTTLLAFPLSRRELPGRNVITFFVAFTMFFSGGLIPTYLLVQKLGMVDRLWAMVIPNAISTFNMILMRTFFLSNIPDELLESAYLDGCGYTKFLISIVLPLSTAIVAALVLYYAVGHWNAYFSALIYLRSSQRASLQLVLRNILLANQISTGGSDSAGFGERAMIGVTVKYAVIIVSSVPVIILYPFIQRYFIKGIMVGAIKG